jgi:hypothetical protein
MAFMATRALNSGLRVRRLVNSCGSGFGNGGYPVLWRRPAYEVEYGLGQENPDFLARCFLGNAYEVWVERDRMDMRIIRVNQTLPWKPCHSNSIQTNKNINYLQDMQQQSEFACYIFHIIYVRARSLSLCII